MSIFGSLGVACAGFKTDICWFLLIQGYWKIDIGFEHQVRWLRLGLVKGRTRSATSSKLEWMNWSRNYIDKSRITEVSHKSLAWNVKMVAPTALLCAFSISPCYIYLSRGANRKKSTIGYSRFCVLCFITATLIQLLIQRRITTLSDQYLIKRLGDQLPNPDVETAVEPGDTKEHQMEARTWLLLCLLLISLVASLVRYVGCFSVVQNSTSTIAPVS